MSLIIDRALVFSEDEAQGILDGVYKHIKLLDCETQGMFETSGQYKGIQIILKYFFLMTNFVVSDRLIPAEQ